MSLIVIAWIGFGQTISRYLGLSSNPFLETSIEGCPVEWQEALANATSNAEASTVTECVILLTSIIFFSSK